MNKDELIATRVSSEQKKLFQETAKKYNITESALLRMLLTHLLKQDAKQLKSILKEIIDKK